MAIENRVREVVDEYVARVRHDLDAHAEALTANLAGLAVEQKTLKAQQDAEWQAQRDQLAAERQAQQEEHEAERRTQLAQLEADRQTLRDQQAAAAGQAALALKAARETGTGTLQRLVGSVRQIDEAAGLNGILEALARATVDQASRVAILLVDGYMFRSWGHFGFESGTEPKEVKIGASGTLAAAMAVRHASRVPPVAEGQESMEPAFMRLSAGQTGLVVPLLVGGEVVAVLYADDTARTAGQEDGPVWTDEVELLARHAAVRLENITSVRAAEAMARPD